MAKKTAAEAAATAAAAADAKAPKLPAYTPSVKQGDVVAYLDHEGTARRATVTYVHPPHKALEPTTDGKPGNKLVPVPESVDLEVQGVAGSGKTRFPSKVRRGDEPGQFNDAA